MKYDPVRSLLPQCVAGRFRFGYAGGCRRPALGDQLCRSRRIRIAGEWRNACSGSKCRRRPICRGIYTKEAILRSLLIRLSALFREPAGARTQDPNIKSVVLYLLSYGFSVGQRKMLSVLVVQMYGLFLFYQNKTVFLYSLK